MGIVELEKEIAYWNKELELHLKYDSCCSDAISRIENKIKELNSQLNLAVKKVKK